LNGTKVKEVSVSMDGSPDKPDMEIHSEDLYVDEEGDWFYRGNKIVRDDIVELFLDNLQIDENGNFSVEWNQSKCALTAADTPFVVSRVDRVESQADRGEQILLRLRHFSREEVLNAATLHVGRGNVLYCRVRNGRFPARFSRPAYYQVAEWVREDEKSGRFYVDLGGNRFYIADPPSAR
jgi:hypothetical protein